MIIGLCGYAQSGKSTAAAYLAKEHGFKRVNFKDALVAEMKERFPDVLKGLLKHYYSEGKGVVEIDDLFRVKPTLVRSLMQNYGTNVRRVDKPNYWVDQWVDKVKATRGNIVVDDVRFFNELSAITELDGLLLRVTRPDITSPGNHVSETEQELFCEDFTISGEAGSHDAIYAQLEEVIKTIKNNND